MTTVDDQNVGSVSVLEIGRYMVDLSRYAVPSVKLPLRPQDRCDRCGGQAAIVLNTTRGQLLLCQADGLRHVDRIKESNITYDGKLPDVVAAPAPSGRPQAPVPGPFRPAHDTEC